MSRIIVEAQFEDGGKWMPLPPIALAGPPGSFTVWCGDEWVTAMVGWQGDRPTVWRASSSRVVGTRRLVRSPFRVLADLSQGPYEMVHPFGRVRWRLGP